jgi:transcription antitermination factor NusG
MPILPAEPNCYPEVLFEPSEEAHSGRAWWVLHTRPRQEKSLARQLLDQNVPFYLPLVAQRGQIRGRAVDSLLPLFPSYLFLLAQPEERVTALATKRVVRAIPVPDQAGLWKDLTQVHRLLISGLPVRPEDNLQPGILVEVRSGPLVGLRGTILRAASGQRFIVQVNFIQRGASVLLEGLNLAAVHEAVVAD